MDLAARYGRGSWVVVTGSTDGIGKAICFEFARRGFNIVQVSRSIDKLEAVSLQLSRETGCQTRHIQCDFSVNSNE
jgi:short-subunit dehydrogenase